MARDIILTLRPTFPTFLLPSLKIPFRRQQTNSSLSSTASATSASASSVSSPISSANTTPSESPVSASYFPDPNNPLANLPVAAATVQRLIRTHPDTLRCSTCATDLAFGSQIVSKGFTGRYGRAYLVAPPLALEPTDKSTTRDLINIRVGRSERRQLVTGWHMVADISCLVCGTKLGWKYVDATEQAQKYKVGKFILETERVVGYRSWEDAWVPEQEVIHVKPRGKMGKQDEVVFDSDDEDECDDIFSGTWDPEVVTKRRNKKFGSRKKSSE